MQFISENKFIGDLGHFFVVLAFATTLMSAISYFISITKNSSEEDSWIKLGRIGFRIHSIAVFGIIGTLLAMLINGNYEYSYIHSHTNSQMPTRYIAVAFWGGQQGSMILWAFWHVVLGLIVQWRSKKWEAPVIGIFALVQVFVTAMLLGVHFMGYKLGISPFVLERIGDPGFGPYWSLIPDYKTFDPYFVDGTGLVPALQNYWMIIHPPTLFLGFASTLVPFAFALGGLIKKDYYGWIKPALPWTFFGIMILGTGILMGGAWAYESLSFGGFWAWDPVENASLVPWLIFVGAGHLMLIAKNKKQYLYLGIVMTFASFLLILYSTFLTRSGILGDSSVHSFTGDGMTEELSFLIFFFVWFSFHWLLPNKKLRVYFSGFNLVVLLFIFLFYSSLSTNVSALDIRVMGVVFPIYIIGLIAFIIVGYSKSPLRQDTEEHLWSREFWMFIGAVVLTLSAAHVTINTSIPVFNKIFGSNIAPVDEIERNNFYNKWQIPFAFVVTLVLSYGQYLNYKKTDVKFAFQRIARSLILSILLTALIGWGLQFQKDSLPHWGLLFASLFAILGNLDYIIKVLRGKMNHAGASIAHMGFGLMMLGTLLSNYKQQIISYQHPPELLRIAFANRSAEEQKEKLKDFENTIFFRNDTTYMNEYFVCYKNKYREGLHIYYEMDYFEVLPKEFKKGDQVRYRGKVFTANESYTSGNIMFNADKEHWTQNYIPSAKEYHRLPEWIGFEPGKKLFSIAPHVQLNTNKQQGNMPEPGTKHYLAKDIFTHLRGMDMRDGLNKYRESYSVDQTFTKDSLMSKDWRFNILFDSIYPVPYSEEHGIKPEDNAVAIRMLLFEKKDTFWVYPKMIEPIVLRKDMEVPIDIEVPEFKTKIGFRDFSAVDQTIEKIRKEYEQNLIGLKDELKLMNKTGDTSQNIKKSMLYTVWKDSMLHEVIKDTSQLAKTKQLQKGEFSIAITNEDNVLMKAIVFPYINILWLGCFIMIIGSIMAVFSRIKGNR